ncbi:ADP-ribosylation factor GTPase-activating protein 3-like isoform X2 [Rhopilema esculentum]|uniref:ADP-ribosylation factor GTPase-activating protein 3-like isoform X2 n=1 Tax=Rhopilema esculentum TaxID=499914 RepID=UPI0031E17FB0
MAEEKVPAKDLQQAFKRLKSSSAENKMCFDCRASNPTWASVTYGVFLCIDCSAVHRSLGVHLTFIRSIQLDTNWTWLQLRSMQAGGNAKANAFFRQHNLTTTDAVAKYNSRVAAMYREKLSSLAQKACQQYGTSVLNIDAHHHTAASPEEKEADFFNESHEASSVSQVQPVASPRNNTPTNNGNSDKDADKLADFGSLAVSPPKTSATKDARVPTIGSRKPKSAVAKKKGGIGAKKSGLGATKVSSNFAEIENEAQKLDKMKESVPADSSPGPSASLQYKSQGMLKEEQKLKNMDPKKAEQMERLGMGFAGHRGGIGHSASDSMNTVEQIDASAGGSTFKDRYSSASSSSGFFDSYGMDDSSPPYQEEPPPSYSRSYEESRSRSNKRDVSEPPTEEIQKKFGNAKSISSRDVFGDKREEDETREKLDRYHGSNAISSADLFGEEKKEKGGSFRSVDYSQLKAGVSQVTGKLSNMASGVIGSLQSRYSGSN